MNKYDLIDAVSNVTCAKKEASDAVNAVFDCMKDAFHKGDKVTISGFGTFLVKPQKARLARNPKTGESVEIPARTAVKFKSSRHILQKQ